jgi:hypothetical protein
MKAVEAQETQPNQVIEDPGFALTSGNIGEREMDMWGCVLLSQGFLEKNPEWKPLACMITAVGELADRPLR